jgi:hypothetical protein
LCLARFQLADIIRGYPLQKSLGFFALNQKLAHVRDIE